jgi:branched-chain amino acid transport system substrate-binding protein
LLEETRYSIERISIMKAMKIGRTHVRTLVVSSMLLCSVLVLGWNRAVLAQKKPFKIGHVAGFTGPLALYNTKTQIGIKLAVDDINKEGGFLGRKIEVISRDGKERPDVSMSEARDLILSQGVDAIIYGATGSAALAVSSVAKEYKIPYLVSPVGTLVTGKEGHRYVFQIFETTALMGYSVGEYLAEKPWKKYCIIGTDYVFSHEVIMYAWNRLSEKKSGVSKVREFWPRMGERDFTTYITAILSSNPDAVIGVLPGSMGIDFIRQAKGFDFFKKVKYLHVPLASEERATLGKEIPNGIMGQASYAFPYCSEHYPLAAKFEKEYNKVADDYEYDSAASGYNQILFLQAAIKKARSTDKEKIIDAGEGLDFETTVGRVKVLKYSHRATVPDFVAAMTYTSKYPLAIFKEPKEYRGQKFMLSEDQIRQMRGQ